MQQLPGFIATRILSEDEHFVLTRGHRDAASPGVLVRSVRRPAVAADEQRLTHEFAIRTKLDPSWAVPPIELVPDRGGSILVIDDPGGDTLAHLLRRPRPLSDSLRIAIALAAALHKMHRSHLVHKDVKPGNILVGPRIDEVRLMNFGITSELPRERQEPEAIDELSGTLAYMAPEQTGRMNRSVDSRSDLYSLGVTLYEFFTGVLPFSANDALEWVHCHIARSPVTACERNPELPPALSAVVMKLLAKSADDRYQTARAVEVDLARCLAEWESSGRIAPFELGEHDFTGRLSIPEKLYGRERETEALLRAFQQVERTGASKTVLVSGYSGVGKSSLVNELHKVILLPRGLFASGKVDQNKRDIPYFTFAQAFRTLVLRVLVQEPAELAVYRENIQQAVGNKGQLLVTLIPELEFVIGKQPPVPELGPVEAQRRFQVVFRRFVGAFARQEHPLVLFLDDLQWLDAASLDLMEHLATHPEVRHLLVIGAYRDNEVARSHPLALKMEAIRKIGVRLDEIMLQPLSLDDVEMLVSDTLSCKPLQAKPLARLIREKTGGNPFFVNKFLDALYEEHLLRFDWRKEAWTWELHHIQARSFTDNVVELMVGALQRLPAPALAAVEHLAVLGNAADVRMLLSIHGGSAEDLHAALLDAVRAGLLYRSRDAYRFAHDRVQEAAYGLIPEARRPEEHLKAAKLLLENTSESAIEEHVFEIVNHFNRGLPLVNDPVSIETVGRLNTIAGSRAKAAAAHVSARTYLAQAYELLPPTSWEQADEDTFNLTLNLAECEFLAGRWARADELFTLLSENTRTDLDRARVCRTRLKLYQIGGRLEDSLRVGLEGLALFGVTFPRGDADVRVAMMVEEVQIRQSLSGRNILDLAAAPRAQDPRAIAVLGLLTDLLTTAWLAQPELFGLLAMKGVNLSLTVGNVEGSPSMYSGYAIVRVIVEDFATASQLCEMAQRLNDDLQGERFRGVLLFVRALSVHHWTHPLAESLPMFSQAFAASVEAGDHIYATFTGPAAAWHALECGAPLSEVHAVAERHKEFAAQIHSEPYFLAHRAFQQVIACLQGRTRSPESLDDDTYNEAEYLAYLVRTRAKPGVTSANFYEQQYGQLACYRVGKQLLALFYGRFEEALRYGSPVQLPGSAWFATHYIHHALVLAAVHRTAPPDRQREIEQDVSERERRIARWAESAPENFGHRHALVAAELARIQGRYADAMPLYEQAASKARDQGFVHYEGLAHETAGRFYLERGCDSIAQGCFRNARAGYARWGAFGKVKELDRQHPGLEAQAPFPGTVTNGAMASELDSLTVLKASQAVSSEIVLGRLIERLLTIAIEYAGADRGLLILPHDDEWRIEAEARTERDEVRVSLRQAPPRPELLPYSVFEFVRRTSERSLVDDAGRPGLHSEDEYVRQSKPRSILCIPLVKQGQLLGVLYLENKVAAYAFTPDRVAMLDLLSSQAAISIENARLYEGIQRENTERRHADERFAKAFFDSPTPMAISRANDDTFVDANEKFLATLGFAKEEFLGHSAAKLGIVDAKLLDSARAITLERGYLQNFEMVAKTKTGNARTVLVSAVLIELENEPCFLVTYLDVTESRLIEAELRQSQKMEAIGRLAGGVAHDFNNLLTVINGYASLALTSLEPEAQLYDSFREVLYAGKRAAGLTGQLLAFSRRQALEPKIWSLNLIVSELQSMLRRLIGEDIQLVTQLAPELPPVLIDRGQIEQVILNLVVNARDAMPEGGRLVMSTTCRRTDDVPVERRPSKERARYVELAVSDTGDGMSEAVKARIFEPFFTTKEAGKGTGLGLATVYGIVTQSAGTIAVDSGLGQGTTFHLFFPEEAPLATAAELDTRPSAAPRGSHETILLVEDDAAVRQLAAQVLEADGYVVLQAASGHEALDRIAEAAQLPRLVISDIVMPDMGGRQLGAQLRERYPGLGILFMSGYMEHRLELYGGPEHFLQKPFAPSELVARVRELLDRGDTGREGSS
jgi:PAS domain S-box-containing protein